MTPTNPLARLIDSTREANGWSDPDVARRAQAAGHQLTKSHISGIRRTGVASLTPNLMRGLAAGLGLPVSEVIRATLETLGLPAGERSVSPEQAIQSDPDLSAATKQALLAVVRAGRAPQADITMTNSAGETRIVEIKRANASPTAEPGTTSLVFMSRHLRELAQLPGVTPAMMADTMERFMSEFGATSDVANGDAFTVSDARSSNQGTTAS